MNQLNNTISNLAKEVVNRWQKMKKITFCFKELLSSYGANIIHANNGLKNVKM